MAPLKVYSYLAHRTRNGCVQSVTSKKKQLLPGRTLGRLLRRKTDHAEMLVEERSPTSNESARNNGFEERDCDTDGSLDNYHAGAMFKQIDALVGSLMVTKSTTNEVTSMQQEDGTSFTLSGTSITSSLRSAKVQEDDVRTNYFQCFNCGEMLENFTNGIASRELHQIEVGEHIELSDDESGISALTDISTSLATDLVYIRTTNTVYADNRHRMKSPKRRILDVAMRDDQSYLEFGSDESSDNIAVESLVRDDISLSFVGVLEEC